MLAVVDSLQDKGRSSELMIKVKIRIVRSAYLLIAKWTDHEEPCRLHSLIESQRSIFEKETLLHTDMKLSKHVCHVCYNHVDKEPPFNKRDNMSICVQANACALSHTWKFHTVITQPIHHFFPNMAHFERKHRPKQYT